MDKPKNYNQIFPFFFFSVLFFPPRKIWVFCKNNTNKKPLNFSINWFFHQNLPKKKKKVLEEFFNLFLVLFNAQSLLCIGNLMKWTQSLIALAYNGPPRYSFLLATSSRYRFQIYYLKNCAVKTVYPTLSLWLSCPYLFQGFPCCQQMPLFF